MMRKPVVDINPDHISDMWTYEYQAKNYLREKLEVIASDSLINLKREVKERGWRLAWISTSKGSFSYGQNIVDEYPYVPRY